MGELISEMQLHISTGGAVLVRVADKAQVFDLFKRDWLPAPSHLELSEEDKTVAVARMWALGHMLLNVRSREQEYERAGPTWEPCEECKASGLSGCQSPGMCRLSAEASVR